MDTGKRDLLWKEYLGMVTGNRILGVVAEAERLLGKDLAEKKGRWIGDGRCWAEWVGRELADAVEGMDDQTDEAWGAMAEFLKGGMRIGYTGELFESGFGECWANAW